MITIKNSILYLSLVASLALGFMAGYFLRDSKSPTTKTVYVNIPSDNTSSENKTVSRTVKTNISAKDALFLASSEAITWAKDAYLSEIDLSSKKFNSDGTSNGWKMTFYSKEKNKTYQILIKDGESRGGEEADATEPVQTLKGEMTDSTALAKNFFGSYPSDTEIINLKMYYDYGAKKFLWTIFFPKGNQTIDAEL